MPFKGRRPQEGMKEQLNLKGTFWTFSAKKFGGNAAFMKRELRQASLSVTSLPTVGNNCRQDGDTTPVQIAP